MRLISAEGQSFKPTFIPGDSVPAVFYFRDVAAEQVEVAFPINHGQVDTLLGRILTQIDASIADDRQNKALKDLLKQQVRAWYEDLEECAGYDRGLGLADFMESAQYAEAQEADRRFHEGHREKLRAAEAAGELKVAGPSGATG